METTFSKKRISAITATVVLAAFAAGAHAAPIRIPESNDGYWTNMDGIAVLNGSDRCWRTGSWTPDKAIPACEGETTDAALAKASATETSPVAETTVPSPDMQTTAPPALAAPVILAQTQFDTNRATLKPEDKEMLDAVADHARESDATVITIGHASSPGTDEHNLELSKRRSQAVKEYLVDNGVDESQVLTVAKGEQEPIADNATPFGRQLNQRVEVEVRPSSG